MSAWVRPNEKFLPVAQASSISRPSGLGLAEGLFLCLSQIFDVWMAVGRHHVIQRLWRPASKIADCGRVRAHPNMSGGPGMPEAMSTYRNTDLLPSSSQQHPQRITRKRKTVDGQEEVVGVRRTPEKLWPAP